MANEGRLALEQRPHVLLLDREQRVPCANGLVVQPHHRYAGLAGFDFAVVPGGRGINALQNDDALLAELSRFQKIGGLLCSVCTGALALAWMQALVDIQREDDGWRPFWAEESSPVYTALAVKALILSGMLARGDLQSRRQSIRGLTGVPWLGGGKEGGKSRRKAAHTDSLRVDC